VSRSTNDWLAMRVLQAICVLFCLLCILSAVTGIQSIIVADRVAITRHSDLGRLYAILTAALCAAAVYGIHRRAPIVWKLGWVVLAASFLSFVVMATPDALRQPPPGCWIISCFIVIGGAVVSI
jgi:hypothetical protein